MGLGSGIPIHTNHDAGNVKRGKDQKASVKSTLIHRTAARKLTITSEDARILGITV